MREFVFTKVGKKYFEKLSARDQEQCLKKLNFFKDSQSFSLNCSKVYNLEPTTHRLRVGDIRMLIKISNETRVEILKVGYRGDIYK